MATDSRYTMQIQQSAKKAEGRIALSGLAQMVADVEDLETSSKVHEKKILKKKIGREYANIGYKQIVQDVSSSWHEFQNFSQNMKQPSSTENSLVMETFSEAERKILTKIVKLCVNSFQSLEDKEKALVYNMLFRFKPPHQYMIELIGKQRDIAKTSYQMLKTYRQMYTSGVELIRSSQDKGSNAKILNGLFYLSKYILFMSPVKELSGGLLSATFVESQLPLLLSMLQKQEKKTSDKKTLKKLKILQANPSLLLQHISIQTKDPDDLLTIQLQRSLLPRFVFDIASHKKSNYMQDLQDQLQSNPNLLLLKTILFYLVRTVPDTLLELFRRRRKFCYDFLLRFIDLPNGGIVLSYQIIDLKQIDPILKEPKMGLNGLLIHQLCSNDKAATKKQLSYYLAQLDIAEIEKLQYSIIYYMGKMNAKTQELRRLENILGKKRKNTNEPEPDYVKNQKELEAIIEKPLPPLSEVVKELMNSFQDWDKKLSVLFKEDIGTSILKRFNQKKSVEPEIEPEIEPEPDPFVIESQEGPASLPTDLKFFSSEIKSFRKWHLAEPSDGFLETNSYLQPIAREGRGQTLECIHLLKKFLINFKQVSIFQGDIEVMNIQGKKGDIEVEKIYTLMQTEQLKLYSLYLCMGLGYNRNAAVSFYQFYEKQGYPKEQIYTFPYIMLFCEKSKLPAGVSTNPRAEPRNIEGHGQHNFCEIVSLSTQKEITLEMTKLLQALVQPFALEIPELKKLAEFYGEKVDLIQRTINKKKS